MNIVYVLHKTDPTDGSTKAFVNLLNGLIPNGINPIVVLPDKKGIYNTLVKMAIPTFVTLYKNNRYPYWNTVKNVLLFLPKLVALIAVNRFAVARITKFLRSFHIDIIHTNVGINSIGFQCAKRLNIPHVYHIREYADVIGMKYFPCQSAFSKQLASPHSYAVCITKDIHRHYGLTGNAKTTVIYDGIRSRIDTMPTSSRKPYLLYVGRIDPVKGLDVLLRGYKTYKEQLSAQEVLPLYVAGDESHPIYASKIYKYVDENGLSNNITFLGRRHDIVCLMSEARALIVPSIAEGFGFCMPEAMFCGCLTIAYNRSGTKEQLDNGLEMQGEEIALRYDNNEELVHHLVSVTRQPEDFYDDYRKRAFLTVNSLYTSECNVQRIMDFYQTMLSASTNNRNICKK